LTDFGPAVALYRREHPTTPFEVSMAQYRKLLLATVYGTLAIVGGACREASVMAPGEAAVAVSEAAGLRKYPENKNHSFTINPGQAVSFRIGDHTISFDAGSVCDKETSTYGPTEWDQPCEPSPKPVNITARASRDSLGNARIDFSPKLRFVPGKDVLLPERTITRERQVHKRGHVGS
jgi:hypothetical protein